MPAAFLSQLQSWLTDFPLLSGSFTTHTAAPPNVTEQQSLDVGRSPLLLLGTVMPVALGVCLLQACWSLPCRTSARSSAFTCPSIYSARRSPQLVTAAQVQSEAASLLARRARPHPLSAQHVGNRQEGAAARGPHTEGPASDLSLHRCSLTARPPDAQVSPQPPSRWCLAHRCLTLSTADTLAPLSSSSSTTSMLLILVAFISGVSPSCGHTYESLPD